MTTINHPLAEDFLYIFELSTGEFIRIDLRTNANGDWVVEHLDKTGEFVAGLQICAEENE